MAEYIERSSAIAAIDLVLQRYYEADDVKAAEAGDDCRFALEKMEAANVELVVHAQWEKITEPDEDGNVWYRCPICQHNDKQSPGIDVPRCWYCGAHMDRKE